MSAEITRDETMERLAEARRASDNASQAAAAAQAVAAAAYEALTQARREYFDAHSLRDIVAR